MYKQIRYFTSFLAVVFLWVIGACISNTKALTSTPMPMLPSVLSGKYASGERYTVARNNGGDTVGVFRPSNGTFYLKKTNLPGFADIAVNYGLAGDYPVVGDWNGDGTETIGVYRNGSFMLRNSNTMGFADVVFAFAAPGDQPIAGDWDGDGIDTIGVYRNGNFLLRNSNTGGPPEMSFFLGNAGDIGIAGDWNGDGVDTTGVFRPSSGALYLKNANTTGFADVQINYGMPGDKPVTGDWNNDGIDTIGVYRNGTFYLRNTNTIGFGDIVFTLGIPGDVPIAGTSFTPLTLGATYHVSPNGDDSNPGTIDQPWKTISKVNTASFSPGDKILFKRGETWLTNETLTIRSSGTSGNPIIFDAYGTGPAPKIINSAANAVGIYADHVTFQNFYVSSDPSTGGNAIVAKAHHDITIQNCEVAGARWYGIFISGYGDAVYNIKLIGNTVHDSVGSGIIIQQSTDKTNPPRNVVITGNTTYSNGTHVHADHGMYINASGGLVAENVSYDNSGAGIKNQSSSNMIWERNLLYATTQGAQNYGFFVDKNTSFLKNENNIFRNNVIYGNQIGIYINNGVNGPNVYYHNTVINNSNSTKTWGFSLEADIGSANQVFQNNIFLQDTRVVGDVSGVAIYYLDTAAEAANNTFDYNDVYINSADNYYAVVAGAKTWAQWRALAGSPDAHSLNVDPLFVARYTNLRLQPNSPILDAGYDLGNLVADDFDGIARPQGTGFDMGAFELFRGTRLIPTRR